MCDDGNTGGGDGCSAVCGAVEANYVCLGSTPDTCMKCGDSVVSTTHGEVCDDGNNLDTDGCSTDCT